jgi:RNA polymerase sigma-70 factor, ECF subfamily
VRTDRWLKKLVDTFSPAELARRVQRTLPEDTRAFEELVGRYKQRVFGIAYRLMGNQQEAEDQTQEVFLKVYRHIRSLEEPATLNSWITQIAVNTCRDALDRRRRRPQTVSIVTEDESGEELEMHFADTRTPSPEEYALRAEMRRCLQDTLQALDTDERAVIVLRDIEDRPYQEIAGALTLGLSAVKMRVHRARLAFQQLLETICPDTSSLIRRMASPIMEAARGKPTNN